MAVLSKVQPMLEKTETLLPQAPHGKTLRVVSVGFDLDSLEELKRLLLTLGVELSSSHLVKTRVISPATYLGKGKLEELKFELESTDSQVLAVDVELSPNQLNNIEKTLDKSIIDRPGVIIEIFSRHARTKESKTQVELAKLQYLLPRLKHFWTHFERQRGGIGLKGMGEKQIEVDRRLIKNRMVILKEKLHSIEKERTVQRSGRKEVLKVALVGYTNAGKSTLLNALTQSHVKVEDKLFATLDASVKSLDPHSQPPIVMIDTVGFIHHLPPALVASFRSTLEELHQADLLIHVVDGSSAQAREQFLVTEKVLKELNVNEKPKITVMNKIDLIKNPSERNQSKIIAPGALQMSALNPKDGIKLRDTILDFFKKKFETWEVLIPYSESKLEAKLHTHTSIEKKKYFDSGTFYRLKIDGAVARKLNLEKYKV